MAGSNIERLRDDLERLIEFGHRLENAMLHDLMGEAEFRKQVNAEIERRAAQGVKFNKAATKRKYQDIPVFKDKYDAWYSESLAVIRQLLPDRLSDFRSLYEKPKARKSITFANYVLQDYLQGLRVTFGGDVVVEPSAALPQFRQQRAILAAARERFSSSLFEVRQVVQAQLFDREIDASRELLKHGFLRAAGAVAGVVLERHLRQVCDDHSVPISKQNPGISDLNDLLKGAGVIDVPQWRHVSLLGDIRNICVHNKKVEPTKDQVSDLIGGADKVLRTIA